MEINEIVEKLKYYTPELPKEAIKEAINRKDEITPKLLEMLEYTKENLNKIYNEEDEFFGYNYAFFILAEFREKKAFPYLIDLLNKDEEIIEYIIGDDYPDYLHRLLASTYNGDDDALFSIIENNQINEFVRCTVLATFSILYLYGVKDRKFIINYFRKLLNKNEENKNSCLYEEIIEEVCDLKLIELEEDIERVLLYIENEEEREDLKKLLMDGKPINRNIFPFKPLYEYINDTIGIMEGWQCFRYIEDEEFEKSDYNKGCQRIIQKREESYAYKIINIGRNDLCFCGSGKKYKNCCMNEINYKLSRLNFIDTLICKAEWYLKRKEEKKSLELYRMAWFDVQEICKEDNIKTVEEYDEKYNGFDSLLNWIQDYEEILSKSDEENKLYDRLELWNTMEEIFDLEAESELYWKERCIRNKANIEFRLGNEEKAKEIIENYLKVKPNWVWGYVEMADWYDNTKDSEHYDLQKAKEILLRAESIKEMEDKEAIWERLWGIYKELGDEKNTKIYADKMGIE